MGGDNVGEDLNYLTYIYKITFPPLKDLTVAR